MFSSANIGIFLEIKLILMIFFIKKLFFFVFRMLFPMKIMNKFVNLYSILRKLID